MWEGWRGMERGGDDELIARWAGKPPANTKESYFSDEDKEVVVTTNSWASSCSMVSTCRINRLDIDSPHHMVPDSQGCGGLGPLIRAIEWACVVGWLMGFPNPELLVICVINGTVDWLGFLYGRDKCHCGEGEPRGRWKWGSITQHTQNWLNCLPFV